MRQQLLKNVSRIVVKLGTGVLTDDRKQPDLAPGTAYVGPPDWLLDGVLALTPGRDRGPLVEAVLLSDKIVPLEEFLRQRPALLDSPAR